MPIDAYSLCPGGTGKKIKFCCTDMLAELQKIERMLEGEQQLACLSHIDRLLQQRDDRACLLAIKGELLRATEQTEAAAANAALFLEKHPANPVAFAESAIVAAAVEGGRAGMQRLQQAVAASSEGIQTRVYEAMTEVAEVLLSEGQWLAGRALLQFQLAILPDDRQTIETLFELNQSAGVPLLVKDDPPLAKCPDDAPWKDRFQQAMSHIGHGRWQAAADGLSELAAEIPDAPAIGRNLATLRGRLADTSGCIEALRRYAALDVPLEDAVEAETIAMIFSEDPLGDLVDVRNVTWTVNDSERLQTALLSDPRFFHVPVDPGAFGEDGGPPPKAIYLLLDRPAAQSAEGVTPESMPNVLCEALFYGRQTDREARLESWAISATHLALAKELLASLAGDALAADVKEELTGRMSASRDLLRRNWLPPRDISAEQLQTLAVADQRHALLEQWPELKLGILGDRSPCEAAADASCRVTLLAAIMLLETWIAPQHGPFDFNELRSRLGLPTLQPIDPRQIPLEGLPLARLSRVVVEELDDDALLLAYRRAVAFNIDGAMQTFAQAIIARPSLAGRPERLRAYRTLAQTAKNLEEAADYVEQGRRTAESAGQSSATWDMLELSLRFGMSDGHGAMRLIQHLQREHIQEPGVADMLTSLLVRAGVLRPDGTPAIPHPPAAQPAEPLAAEPGELWTPGSEHPGGGGKLWVPE